MLVLLLEAFLLVCLVKGTSKEWNEIRVAMKKLFPDTLFAELERCKTGSHEDKAKAAAYLAQIGLCQTDVDDAHKTALNSGKEGIARWKLRHKIIAKQSGVSVDYLNELLDGIRHYKSRANFVDWRQEVIEAASKADVFNVDMIRDQEIPSGPGSELRLLQDMDAIQIARDKLIADLERVADQNDLKKTKAFMNKNGLCKQDIYDLAKGARVGEIINKIIAKRTGKSVEHLNKLCAGMWDEKELHEEDIAEYKQAITEASETSGQSHRVPSVIAAVVVLAFCFNQVI